MEVINLVKARIRLTRNYTRYPYLGLYVTSDNGSVSNALGLFEGEGSELYEVRGSGPCQPGIVTQL